MNRPNKLSTLISLIAVATALLSQTAASQTKDERDIRAAGQAWQRYIAEQKVDSIVALHTPDAVVLFANGPAIKGSSAIRSTWGEVVKIPAYSVAWTPTRIDVASPTVATEYGTYTESYESPEGRKHDAGNYVTIWNKVNGKWRIALDAPVSTSPAPAPMPAEATAFISKNASAITWGDFAPPGFPPGAKIAVLSGDPSKAGAFVLRLSFPADYLVPLHWHPTAETVTVLSGQLHFGMGNTVDMAQTQSYGPGDFVFIPARHGHFVHAATAAVLQLSGNGPFQLSLGAPK